MLSMRLRFIFCFITVSLVLLPARMWGQTAQAPDSAAGVAPAAEPRAPSTKADIAYLNGQLTIKGNGAALIQVLRDVCKKIGAELDAQVKPADPVSDNLGPGAPKDVLDALLTDAHVNYVLGVKATDPDAVTNVTISPQAEDSAGPPQATQGQEGGPTQENSATSAPVRSEASQMLELINAARGELATGVNLDPIDDGTGSTGAAKQADVAAVVQQIEAQLKQAEQSASQNQQADMSPQDTSGTQSNIVNPTHRPMHRKHH